ncbi:MAG TPA: hypothetical protein PLB55_23115 [Prosthecobacter sp.]|jgi:hypothetical protein|nr:hypothetical protein [Prosthecobacter sp.]
MNSSISANGTVSFDLGEETTLAPLYPYTPPGVKLADCINHTINQTLLRDLQYGAWAYVGTTLEKKADKATGKTVETTLYHVKIVSPDPKADLTRYATQIPAFLKAAGMALRLFYQGMAKAKTIPTGVSFLPPFGLAMMNTASIQLLHYPPSETLNYMDYLYSPTNRRWENLLGCNGFPGARNTLLETIVDLLPIAANGGAAGAAAIQPFGTMFKPYVDQMLNLLLRATPNKKATQPIVAYGGPVMNYLQTTCNPKDLSGKITGNKGPDLAPLSLVSLPLLEGGPQTAVLCANHPAQFMYYDPSMKDDPNQGYAHFRTVLQQDLIAAGWQSEMSRNPEAKPLEVLQKVHARWTGKRNQERVDAIFDMQVSEFG